MYLTGKSYSYTVVLICYEPTTQISYFQLQLYETINELKSSSFQMSHDALELLREKKAREYVINEFRQRAIVMTWEEDKAGTVTVFPFVHDINKQDTLVACSFQSLLVTECSCRQVDW